VRRFTILFAALLPGVVVAVLLLVVTSRREHVRKSEESVLDANVAALDVDVEHLRAKYLDLVRLVERLRQEDDTRREAMRAQLETVRAELIKANQHVLALEAELDRAHAAAAAAAAPAPVHTATH